ncbi:beta-ketoadipate pathway transcriptional regulator, PcaR/PcaU/PobR family [compost metagenome]
MKARIQGYAWVDGELDESICGLAIPVRNKEGETIAAINVSLPTGQFTSETAAEQFLPELRLAASRLRAVMP